jgi:hypothetical protein
VASPSLYSIATGSIALSASATKSLWLLDPVTNGFSITEIGVSFDGSAAATAVRIDLYQVSSIGSPAGTTATVNKFVDTNIGAATTTGLTALSAEPTTVAVLQNWFLTPFSGLLEIQYPLGREPGAGAGLTTNRLGLRAVTPSGVTPNVVSHVVWQE